jgi:UDP-glucose 4-epimerase
VAGLIGYNFATWLLNHTHHRVIGIDAMHDWGNHNEVNPNIRYDFHKLDILNDYDALEDIIKKSKVRIIYHFASYAAEGLSPFMRRFNYIQNTLVSANIINLAIKYNCKLIFTSSMSVYGYGKCKDSTLLFDEHDRPEPIDPYGIAKWGVEQDIRNAGEQHGLRWVILRPHNVFGIGQNVNDHYRNVLGIWMHQAITGEPFTIYGDGEHERAFTYIDNILEPLYKAKDLENEIINLGGMQGITLNEACEVMKKITGKTEVVYLESRQDVKRAIPDPTRSITRLGYKDTINFEDGLKRMWDWVRLERKVNDWYEWDKFEVDKDVYSYWK